MRKTTVALPISSASLQSFHASMANLSDAEAEGARRRRRATPPTRAAPTGAAPAGSAPAAAVATVPATATPATAVPVGQLHMLDRSWTGLWCRSGIGGARQSDGRKTKRTSDCTRTDNLL